MELLEGGASRSVVVSVLRARYGVSRSAAYRDAEAAEVKLQVQDAENPDSWHEPGHFDSESIIATLQAEFLKRAASRDYKAMNSLIASIDKARRWSATSQHALD